ncbi:Cysteine and histidine-rich domain-containing protein [Diplonema papillatum]|nr:Cysteine and histidine-rich domain-containing protein [Diplonema papillatum]
MSVYDAVLEKHQGDGLTALLAFLTYLQDKEPTTTIGAIHEYAASMLPTQTTAAKDSLMAMPVTVTASAKKAFEKALVAQAEKPVEEDEESGEIPIGRECVRQGCSTKYTGPESLKTVCVHHPGHAVFHETYKYWSCCDRTKKYDFDEFRAIRGCREGTETCAFTRAAAGLARKAPCRYDFFQVGSTITISIYAKKVDPEKCSFLISSTQLRVQIYFDFGKEFSLNRNLPSEVIPSECKVEIKEPKIEITLKKGGDVTSGVTGAAWPDIGTEIEE